MDRMAPRGRPALTEDVLRERTAAYCSRYGVKDFNEAGLPAFPAGERESRQHRDWVNLFKAWSRFRHRTAAPQNAERVAVVRWLCRLSCRHVSPLRTGAGLGGRIAAIWALVGVASAPHALSTLSALSEIEATTHRKTWDAR